MNSFEIKGRRKKSKKGSIHLVPRVARLQASSQSEELRFYEHLYYSLRLRAAIERLTVTKRYGICLLGVSERSGPGENPHT